MNIMPVLLKDCEKFYQDFVREKCMNMQAAEEIAVTLKYIDEEDARAKYYIHEERSKTVYYHRLSRLHGLH